MTEISYQVTEVKTIKELKEFFPNGEAGDHWLFLSTGAQHGSTLTLDDVERIIRDEDENWAAINDKFYITALVVHPRRTAGKTGALAVIDFGELLVSLDDVNFLRKVVRSTLESVKKSQEGNW